MQFRKLTLTALKPNDIPKELKTLGDHLKKRRLELQLFQKEVSLRLGINEWTYHNWETDKSEPVIRMYPRIIEFLGYYPFPEPQMVGEKLVAYRRQHGLARSRLASMVGIDEGTVLRAEQGGRFIAKRSEDKIELFLKENSLF